MSIPASTTPKTKTVTKKKASKPAVAKKAARAPVDDGVSSETGFLDGMNSKDPLAERLGEEFVQRALSGQDEGADILAEEIPEDLGGPFVETEGDVEFATGSDASNPSWGTREPFPKT